MMAGSTPAIGAGIGPNGGLESFSLWPSNCRTVSKLPGSASSWIFALKWRNWCAVSTIPARFFKYVVISHATVACV